MYLWLEDPLRTYEPWRKPNRRQIAIEFVDLVDAMCYNRSLRNELVELVASLVPDTDEARGLA